MPSPTLPPPPPAVLVPTGCVVERLAGCDSCGAPPGLRILLAVSGDRGCWCRDGSAMPDEVAQAVAHHYHDNSIVSAIVKIRKKAEQAGEGSDAAEQAPPSPWMGWIRKLW